MEIYIINIVLLFIWQVVSRLLNNPKKFVCVMMTIQLTAIIGLRAPDIIQSGGLGDMGIYLDNYSYLANVDYKEALEFNNYKAPLFYLLMHICSGLSIPFQLFVFSLTLISVSSTMYYIYKYSKNEFLSILVYLGMGAFVFSFYLMRQMLAVPLMLFAMDKYIKRGAIKALIIMVVSALIHRYSIIVGALFLLGSIKNSKYMVYTYLMILPIIYYFRMELGFLLVVLFSDDYIGYYISSGEIGGMALFYISCLCLYCFLYSSYSRQDNKLSTILLHGMIVITVIQIFASYAYAFTRLNYFINQSIFMIALPYMLNIEIIKRKIGSCGIYLYYPLLSIFILSLVYMYFSGIEAEGIDDYRFFW